MKRFSVLLTAVGVMLVTAMISAQAPGGGAPQGRGGGAAPQLPEPKNLKFFPKEMTAQQIIPIMANFNAALGVNCGYCHVFDGPPATNPKNETMAYTYNSDGYLIAVDGPLPGTNDVIKATYDLFGRMRTITGLTGYTMKFDYDPMNRITKITHPDSTFEQLIYDRLDVTNVTDRAGRQTLFEFDNVRRMKKRTDPLGRVTLFDWCLCGQIKSLTDPMGRTTT